MAPADDRSRRRVVVVRADNLGDVLLSGPAIRAVAASGAEVVYLCSPVGRPAAEALPGVSSVVAARLPWIEADPGPATADSLQHLAGQLTGLQADEAVIFTSFHQSPLPAALLLRMAGVERISAISVDYPGSLLDVRHLVDEDIHEVERALSLARAAGYPQPADDDGALQLRPEAVSSAARETVLELVDGAPYVVVHPGASVPARAWDPDSLAGVTSRLTESGLAVVVTGGRSEQSLCARVTAGATGRAMPAVDMAGRTDFATLAGLLAGAVAVVCGNTGPAHLAAAVGTPVVSLYAPTVPASRWRPWMVPHVLLGDQDIECSGCRSRVCPVADHPCLARITPADVAVAVTWLLSGRRHEKVAAEVTR